MVEQLELYLAHIPRCPFCPDDSGTVSGKDHIFPRVFFKSHKVFLPLRQSIENFVCVCPRHHARIDNSPQGKIRAFRNDGIEGLVKFIAAYPRAINPDILNVQHNQWIVLFSHVKAYIEGLNGNTPIEYKEAYDRTCEMMDQFVTVWQQGNFVMSLPRP